MNGWWLGIFFGGFLGSLAQGLGALGPEGETAKTKRIGAEKVYKTVGERDLKVYVVSPPGTKPGDKHPAVVWFHGGAWVKGGPAAFNAQAEYLATRGIVSLQVEYRLMPAGFREPPEVCVFDARSAMRWVCSHGGELGIDPDRIAAGGGSAGGHLAAVCGMINGIDDPQDDRGVAVRPRALLLFCPVLDTGPKTTWGRNQFGDRAEEFSPAHHVGAQAPPTLLLVGTEDRLVPVASVKRFQQDMQKAGVRCEAVYYEGQGHGFFNPNKSGPQYEYETLLEVDKFLASLGWLSGPPTLSRPPGGG